MLLIYKSPSADTRTAKGDVTKSQLLHSSLMHIEDVRKALYFFMLMLNDAGYQHDHTKIDHIDEFYEDFSKGLKGEDFKKGDWFQLHLTERHHLTDRCPDDVTLIDVLERVADICMAGMARSGEVYDDELDPEILVKAYKNTIKLLISQIKVIDPEDPIQLFSATLNENHLTNNQGMEKREN